MLRRLVLLAALFSPVAGLAQTAGQVLISPTAFGASDCASTTMEVTISWTSSSKAAITTGDAYRVFLSKGSIACSSATPGVTQFKPDITATSLSQSYPGVADPLLYANEFMTGAGVSCGTTTTVNICVQHIGTSSTMPKGYAEGTVIYEAVAPPVPTGVSVQPGDSSLFVSWSDGTSTGVPAVSYNVTAVDPANTADTHTQNFTGKTNNRIGGLTNGVTYSVTVTSVSAGGNESTPSLTPATGTPQPVSGFWEQYTAGVHREQGGCSGGPAGLVALLGVAMALRGLRRRS